MTRFEAQINGQPVGPQRTTWGDAQRDARQFAAANGFTFVKGGRRAFNRGMVVDNGVARRDGDRLEVARVQA